MQKIFVLMIVSIAALSARAGTIADWKEFQSKEGRFTVMMPGKPEQGERETESDFGKGVLHFNLLQDGPTLYGVNYSDFPQEITKIPAKEVFDSSREGTIANVNGKLSKETEIKLGENVGREIQIAVADGKLLMRTRVYLVGTRLYQVVIFGSREAAISKDADKFFDSFKLVAKP